MMGHIGVNARMGILVPIMGRQSQVELNYASHRQDR